VPPALDVENLEPRHLLAANPIINEFLARNDGGLRDGDGRASDWIEIYNAGDEALDLAGYRLTDDARDLSKWSFPSVDLNPGDYLVVFASGRSGTSFVDAEGNLHTNFTLKRGGDYVALVSPQGTVISEFGPRGSNFPEQVANVSYGTAQSITLVDSGSDASYWVPLNDSLGLTWTEPAFNAAAAGFAAGKPSFGYETRPTNRVNFTGQFQTELPAGTYGVYTRMEFDLADPSALSNLTMRVKYDDGFVAYINGVKVAQENAPDNPGWFSTAPDGTRRDQDALEFVQYDLTAYVHALARGKNVLAIHGMNNFTDNSDMLLVAELDAAASNMRAALGTPAKLGYMPIPTPGAPNVGNDQVYAGFVADTSFSVHRGFYNSPQQVEISTETQGAKVYYTTNGSEPSPTNSGATLYTQPVPVTTTTVLRAAAFKDDFLPTNVDTQTYIFVAHVPSQGNTPAGYPTQWKYNTRPMPADYEMDPEITQNPAYRDILDDALLAIPTISLVTAIENLFDRDTGIYMNPLSHGMEWERPASVELIFPDGSEGFQQDAGVRIQGGASREPDKSPKHGFRLNFRGQYGAPKLEYPLFANDPFGETAVEEFDTIILRAGFNQSWIHHNTFLGDNRGRAQYVRDQWAKDTQNAMGWPSPHNNYAHLYVNGLYWGLYNPTERPNDSFAAQYYGGEKDEYDVINAGEVLDGNNEAWNKLIADANAGLADPAKYEAFAQTLDIDAFIDYILINHYGGNMDWDDHNWYAFRRRVPDGKWHFMMWDSEFLFISPNDNVIRTDDNGRSPGRLFKKLLENDEFRVKLADHVQRHAFNDGVLTPQSVVDRWEARSSQIPEAIVAESARWGDYRRDVALPDGQFVAGVPYELLERDVQWVRERNRLLTEYFPVRTEIFLQQYRNAGWLPATDTPLFNQHGGAVPPGFRLTISNPNESGTVYYTLDGTDPRLAGGAVAPGALRYQGAPLALAEIQRVKARALKDREWSALVEADFFVSAPDSPFNLRISEVNFHPHAANLVAGLAEADVARDQFEFVELTNISTERIDVSNVEFTRGIQFTFPAGTALAPGQHLVVAKNRAAFQSRYGAAVNIVGEFASGDLSDSGERLELRDAAGNLIQSFSFGLGTALPARAMGGGSTLEVDPATGSLVPSTRFGGSPGSAGFDAPSPIVVTELLAHSAAPQLDMIELYNTSGSSIDIGHWYIGNSASYFAHRIPAGISVPATGYHVINETQLGFGLNSGRGGEVWVIQADASGRPVRFVDHVQYGPSALGVSLGPWPDLDGPFLPLSEATFGRKNSGLKYADVLISEVHYNPVDPDGRGIIRAKNLEFIELYNQSDTAADLTDWRLTGGAEYTFPAGTLLEPGKTLLVVAFDPSKGTEKIVFGFQFGVDPATPVMGPYSKELHNDGALVQLERPDLAPVEEPTFTPYLTLDWVEYDDVSPWSTTADEGGDSLTRIAGNTLGHFPASWTARRPSPGSVDFVLRIAGDANEDGLFNQLDIVRVLQGGKFLTRQPATWSEGDWTGDGVFDQLDIVAALQSGSYRAGP
jgi:hypothetical protein